MQRLLLASGLLCGASAATTRLRANGPAADRSEASFELTVLHVNDVHSHLGSERLAHEGRLVDYGGAANVVAAFRALEASNKNVVKIHAGDAIVGTSYYSLFKGKADLAFMAQVCFDAFELGNHEFDYGNEALARFLGGVQIPCRTAVLAANVKPRAGTPLAERIRPYVVREVGGQKVGIVGVDAAWKTQRTSSPDPGTVFGDEAEAAQRCIDELEKSGVSKIIVVAHMGLGKELELAAKLRGADVVVGGDSHTLMGAEKSLGRLNLQGVKAPYPKVVKGADGGKTCVVQAWHHAHAVGELHLSFDAGGHVLSCAGSPRFPVPEGERTATLAAIPEVLFVKPDAAVVASMEPYVSVVEEHEGEVIGHAREVLCHASLPGRPTFSSCPPSATVHHGSEVATLIAEAWLIATPSADFGLQNAGAVRADILAGNHSIADAEVCLPFADTLVTLRLTGAQLNQTLQDAMDRSVDGIPGAYPYMSGLSFEVDIARPKGHRVSGIRVNPRLSGKWRPLNATTTYRVVTNSYVADGGDGYVSLDEASIVQEDQARHGRARTHATDAWISYVRTLRGGIVHPRHADYSTRSFRYS